MAEQVAHTDARRIRRGIFERLQLRHIGLGERIELQLALIAQLEDRESRECLAHRSDTEKRVRRYRLARLDALHAVGGEVQQAPVLDDTPHHAGDVLFFLEGEHAFVDGSQRNLPLSRNRRRLRAHLRTRRRGETKRQHRHSDSPTHRIPPRLALKSAIRPDQWQAALTWLSCLPDRTGVRCGSGRSRSGPRPSSAPTSCARRRDGHSPGRVWRAGSPCRYACRRVHCLFSYPSWSAPQDLLFSGAGKPFGRGPRISVMAGSGCPSIRCLACAGLRYPPGTEGCA